MKQFLSDEVKTWKITLQGLEAWNALFKQHLDADFFHIWFGVTPAPCLLVLAVHSLYQMKSVRLDWWRQQLVQSVLEVRLPFITTQPGRSNLFLCCWNFIDIYKNQLDQFKELVGLDLYFTFIFVSVHQDIRIYNIKWL